MTCETCNGTHEIQKEWPVDYFGHDHYTRPERDEVPCPDCRRCTACGLYVDGNPMKPLHEWRPTAWWCEGECFTNWLFAHMGNGSITPIYALVLVLVVKDVYTQDPDADHGYAFETQTRLTEAVEQLEREIAQQARPVEAIG